MAQILAKAGGATFAAFHHLRTRTLASTIIAVI
jgi:hypothetical protein